MQRIALSLLTLATFSACKKPSPPAPAPAPRPSLTLDAGGVATQDRTLVRPVRDGVQPLVVDAAYVIADAGARSGLAARLARPDAGTTVQTAPRVVTADPNARVVGGSVAMASIWRSDGSVYRWFDPGTTQTTPFDLVLTLPHARQFAGGVGASGCAILSDRTVSCWGSNINGQLGGGKADYDNHNTPSVVPGVAGVTQIAASSGEVCALLEDHTVRCWGRRNPAAMNPVAPTTLKGWANIRQIALAEGVFCALTQDNQVKCAGDNHWGVFANGERSHASEEGTPAPMVEDPQTIPNLTDVAEISLSDVNACARKTNGTVVCWGGGFGNSPVPVEGIANATSLASGTVFEATATSDEVDARSNAYTVSCAVLQDATLACWTSQTTDDTKPSALKNRVDPVRVIEGLVNVRGVSAGPAGTERWALAWTTDNRVFGISFRTDPPRVFEVGKAQSAGDGGVDSNDTDTEGVDDTGSSDDDLND